MLRLVQRTAGMHKLSPPWEGPFIVSRALRNDSYYLIDAQAQVKNKMDRSREETKKSVFISVFILVLPMSDGS